LKRRLRESVVGVEKKNRFQLFHHRLQLLSLSFLF